MSSEVIKYAFQTAPEKIGYSLNFFELKQLADMESIYKRQSIQAMKDYKIWQQGHDHETDIIQILYGGLQGAVLKQRAKDTVTAYWIIRKDFRKWYGRYMAENKCFPANKN